MFGFKRENRRKQGKHNNNSEKFQAQLKEMGIDELKKLQKTLLEIIKEGENTENVIAAMSQNRAIMFELLSRKKHE